MPIDMINVIGNHVLIFMIIKLPKPKRLDNLHMRRRSVKIEDMPHSIRIENLNHGIQLYLV